MAKIQNVGNTNLVLRSVPNDESLLTEYVVNFDNQTCELGFSDGSRTVRSFSPDQVLYFQSLNFRQNEVRWRDIKHNYNDATS